MQNPIASFRNILIVLLSLTIFVSSYLSSIAAGEETSKDHQGNSQDSLTLLDCYKMALKQSETVAIQKEMIKEAEGRFTQYVNRIFPKASFSTSNKIQNGSGGSAFTLTEIPESKFVFSQPIFSGFKELATIAGSRYEKKQRIQEKIRAEQLLFTDVSDAFYLLLSYWEDFESLAAIRRALEERVEELKKREELGRSRPSEVANAEARLSRIEADLEQSSSDGQIARELLEFLTGHAIGKIVDSPPSEEPAISQEDYVSKAQTRPDVLAAKEAWEVAKKQIVVAQSGYWPVVSAEGNYYTKRVGASEGVDWDATLKVDVPITDVGVTTGKLKEANAQEREAKLRYEQTRRSAVLDIKSVYLRFQTAQKRLKAIEDALNASEKNYKLQMEDYRLSLVNNLDVLQALADLQQARRDFVAAKTEARRSYWNFKVATGEIPYDTR